MSHLFIKLNVPQLGNRGATAIEYGLIAALIALAALAGTKNFGMSLADMWNRVQVAVSG